MEKHTHHPPRRSPNTHKRPPTKSVRQRRLLSSPLLVRETRGASPAAVRTRRAPPPSSLPPCRGRHSPRGDGTGPADASVPAPGSGGAAGRGTLPLSPRVFLCRAVLSRAALPLPPPALLPARPSPPPPRDAERRAGMRSAGKRCGAVPSRRAGRERLCRHRPAPPATCRGSPGGRSASGDSPHRPAPPASLCLPLQRSPAVLGAGHAAEGCCFFGV